MNAKCLIKEQKFAIGVYIISKYSYTFKILMMGAGSVGKTALCEKYVTGLWNPLTQLTIGVDFHIKTMKIDDKTVKLQIWDMGGEDRFRFLLSTYCLGAQGA